MPTAAVSSLVYRLFHIWLREGVSALLPGQAHNTGQLMYPKDPRHILLLLSLSVYLQCIGVRFVDMIGPIHHRAFGVGAHPCSWFIITFMTYCTLSFNCEIGLLIANYLTRTGRLPDIGQVALGSYTVDAALFRSGARDNLCKSVLCNQPRRCYNNSTVACENTVLEVLEFRITHNETTGSS